MSQNQLFVLTKKRVVRGNPIDLNANAMIGIYIKIKHFYVENCAFVELLFQHLKRMGPCFFAGSCMCAGGCRNGNACADLFFSWSIFIYFWIKLLKMSRDEWSLLYYCNSKLWKLLKLYYFIILLLFISSLISYLFTYQSIYLTIFKSKIVNALDSFCHCFPFKISMYKN